MKLESDVDNESKRIQALQSDQFKDNEPLVVKNLLKTYRKNKKSFIAVNKLNFGIKESTCFGLLGLNGAGKTTRELNMNL